MAVSRLSQHSIQNAFPKGNTVWDGTTATSAFDSLGAVLLSASAATIVFSNIPATYTHLQLRGITHSSSTADASDIMQIKINSNTSGYANHRLGSNGSAAYSGAETSNALINLQRTAASSGVDAQTYGATIIDILDYANTNKLHVLRTLTGFETSSQGQVYLTSGFHTTDTSAITTLTLSLNVGSFTQYSSFALYGVK
jgi:hypothetical protein